MKIIVIFSNRTDTMFFSRVFQKMRLNCEIVNTPKHAKFSCTISARINSTDRALAYRIVQQYGLTSFMGFSS